MALIGNTLSGNEVGIAIEGGAGGPARPRLIANTVVENKFGIQVSHTFGGSLVENELRDNRRGLHVRQSDALTIVDNTIVGSKLRSVVFKSGEDPVITDNVFQPGAEVHATGALTFERNRFPDDTVWLEMSTSGSLRVADNGLPRLFVFSEGPLAVERNTARAMQVQARGAVSMSDNEIVDRIRATSATELAVVRNRFTRMFAESPAVSIVQNDLGEAFVSADRGNVTDNEAGRVSIRSRLPIGAVGDDPGAFVVSGNVAATLKVGAPSLPVGSAAISGNVVRGRLSGSVRHDLEVRHNEAAGIACTQVGAGAELILAENVAHKSSGAGLLVIGGGKALIDRNIVSESADAGLATRQATDVTIAGNVFRLNAAGGISLLVAVGGDCNDDTKVTLDELVAAVGVALYELSYRTCRAADLNGDGSVHVDEVMTILRAALGADGERPIRVRLTENHVEQNERFGINVFAPGGVSATGNRVVGNGGIALAVQGGGTPDDVAIIGNLLGLSRAEGLLLERVGGARVRNNVIFSNGEAGVLLRDASGTEVVNNRIYANGNDGIAVGAGSPRPTMRVLLMNNTLYGNGGWGITVGNPGVPNPETTFVNNIVVLNQRGGVAAELDSVPDIMLGFNLNNDRYEMSTVPGLTDFNADPRFVAPAGPDGVLGSIGFADDDFHLSRDRPRSAAIDAGSATAASLGISGSAVAGQVNDVGVVDLGYHYGAGD